MKKINLEDYGSGISVFYGIYQSKKWITHEFVKGTISKESEKPITSETRFDIASLTKTFTAVLIHKAQEENLFTFQTKIKEIEPNFKRLENVTIEDLLCHRQEIWTEGYLADAKTKEEFYQMLFTAYVKYPNPKYVDTHYIILSKILETVYQKSLSELMEEKILNPLHLTNTSFHINEKTSVASSDGELLNGKIISVPLGELHDKKARTGSHLSITMGHAGLFSTAKDLFLLLSSLIEESTSLLKQESIYHFFHHDDYDAYLKKCQENKIEDIISPYTYGGTRYKIKGGNNPVRVSCSDDAYLFSGYTGPLYLIDREQKIIIVVMINSIHQSRKSRKERLDAGISIIEEIYKTIKKEFFI